MYSTFRIGSAKMIRPRAVPIFYCSLVLLITCFHGVENKSVGTKRYPKKYSHGIQRKTYAHLEDFDGINYLPGIRRAAEADTVNGNSKKRFEYGNLLQGKPSRRSKRSVQYATGSPLVDTERKHHKKSGTKDAKLMKQKLIMKKPHGTVGNGLMDELSKTIKSKPAKNKNKEGYSKTSA